jgi:hypothetical protein
MRRIKAAAPSLASVLQLGLFRQHCERYPSELRCLIALLLGAIAVADIFISYSKPDRDKVVMLGAYLESEGWSVWWYKNLNSEEH